MTISCFQYWWSHTYPPFWHVLCDKTRRHRPDRRAAPRTGHTEVQDSCHGEYNKAFCSCKRSDVANSVLHSTFLLLQSISPGLVETEMPSEELLKMCPALKPEDIAAGVLYVLGAPPHVQVRVECDVTFYSDFRRVVSRNSKEQIFAWEDGSCSDGQVSLPCSQNPSTYP